MLSQRDRAGPDTDGNRAARPKARMRNFQIADGPAQALCRQPRLGQIGVLQNDSEFLAAVADHHSPRFIRSNALLISASGITCVIIGRSGSCPCTYSRRRALIYQVFDM